MKHFALALLAATAVLASSTLAGPLLRRERSVLVLREAEPVAGQASAEFEHQPATKRAFFRSLLRDRIDRERRGDRKRLLRRVLADDDLQTLAIAYADYLQALEPTLAVEDGDPDGKFIRFFQFILDNQEEIIAFIMKIIALFDSMGVEQPVPRGT